MEGEVIKTSHYCTKAAISPGMVSRWLPLVDHTFLQAKADEQTFEAFVSLSVGQPIASICVFPERVAQVDSLLSTYGQRHALTTVANFPEGSMSDEALMEQLQTVCALNIQEVDVVVPYHALMADNESAFVSHLQMVRQVIPSTIKWKAILETGRLINENSIKRATALACDAGVDFVKTSTGFEAGASLQAVQWMLEVIRERGGEQGIKVSGGIRHPWQVAQYMMLMDDLMGTGWACPEKVRFGSSQLLHALIKMEF